MTIGGWIYNRIINSSSINAIISGNCFPDIAEYSSIPSIVYTVISQNNKRLFRSQIVSLKCIETTQDKCETLNELMYNLFDDSTSRIFESSSNIKIESVVIANNITSLYDQENQTWTGILDVKINYIK